MVNFSFFFTYLLNINNALTQVPGNQSIIQIKIYRLLSKSTTEDYKRVSLYVFRFQKDFEM